MKIGVTGGIGSGKSTVCRIFNILGIPVFSADDEAKKIMNSDEEVIEMVRKIAGKDVYSSGTLNRSELASIIFNDKMLLQEINQTVHPHVYSNFKAWAGSVSAPYVVMESALLFESNATGLVDKIVTVTAPVEERVERVVRGNNLTREQVVDRIKNQMDDEEKIRLSDYVIYNSERDMIIPAVLKIHQEILLKKSI
jgi:dephospho-CoA kinase